MNKGTLNPLAVKASAPALADCQSQPDSRQLAHRQGGREGPAASDRGARQASRSAGYRGADQPAGRSAQGFQGHAHEPVCGGAQRAWAADSCRESADDAARVAEKAERAGRAYRGRVSLLHGEGSAGDEGEGAGRLPGEIRRRGAWQGRDVYRDGDHPGDDALPVLEGDQRARGA